VKRLAFVRHFVRPTGGNFTLRAFFSHARAYAGCETRIAFTRESRDAGVGFWSRDLGDAECSFDEALGADLVAVNGKDWRLLPGDFPRPVIHFVQHLGYSADPTLRGYLARPAWRICVSEAVRASIAPHANGPMWVVPNAVDGSLYSPAGPRLAGSVLIAGFKQPGLALSIAASLQQATVVTEWISHDELAALMRAHDLFVGLPSAEEGFYLPPLEAMACGCAVICADARGNGGHCIPEQTCLRPQWGDVEDHLRCVRLLLDHADLRERIRSNGLAMAAVHSLAAQREGFHAVLDSIFGACTAK
jgi:hypothetical protein